MAWNNKKVAWFAYGFLHLDRHISPQSVSKTWAEREQREQTVSKPWADPRMDPKGTSYIRTQKEPKGFKKISASVSKAWTKRVQSVSKAWAKREQAWARVSSPFLMTTFRNKKSFACNFPAGSPPQNKTKTGLTFCGWMSRPENENSKSARHKHWTWKKLCQLPQWGCKVVCWNKTSSTTGTTI